jgi:DNA topoisomerase-1
MAKSKTQKSGGTPLVIVESPAKAKTIAKFLGKGFLIEASIGHIRDLPSSAREIPAAQRGEKWARLGIDIEHEYRPLYVVPTEKREQMRKLKALLKQADMLYLATDEDREGESISWHLVQELKPKVPVLRLVFHEITKEAIHKALESPRDIDQNLVEAQETRRILDRLYGYSVSPLLWRKIRPRLSAGRVQSVAVRLVVEREHERLRFHRAAYWDIEGEFSTKDGVLRATLASVGGRRVATGKDFDPATGELEAAPAGKEPVVHLREADAVKLARSLASLPADVSRLEQKPFTEKPSAPFTTSTLQQEAARKLRFTAQRTMRAAQRLYENGLITYMRTDSTTLSQEAVRGARDHITREFGAKELPSEPRTYATKVRNAQEAHEAIRPAGQSFVHPRDLPGDVGEDERRVYDLVWRRTVASQMHDAQCRRTTVEVAVGEARFTASGKTIESPGFRLAYVEDDEEESDTLAERAAAEGERTLPAVAQGDRLGVERLTPSGHETQPPPRLTEAGLIKELEARGIGRPSTYASIIETILARDYCFKKGSALVPTFTAFAVVKLLDEYLHHLVDYEFTARMEEELDEISNGSKNRLDYLTHFYAGNGRPGLKTSLEKADKKIKPQDVCKVLVFPDALGEIEVRVGRYGPFLSQKASDRRASLPDDIAPDELTAQRAHDILEKGSEPPKSLGRDTGTNLEIFVKVGRFGPYVQRGTVEDAGKKAKPKMASLLKGQTPETLTLPEAIALLSLPREVGRAVPKPPAPVEAAASAAGTSAAATAAPAAAAPAAAGESPAADAAKGKKRAAAKKAAAAPVPAAPADPNEPLPILAANGRFGPYLRFGTETRSIPAGESPTTITLERALELFAQPKARGRGRAAAKVLKDLGKHPQSGADVRILDGKYGAYVTDGKTNANVPRDSSFENVTMPQAVELLAARAGKGPAKKRRR